MMLKMGGKALMIVLLLWLVSCNQQVQDKDIKQTIASSAKKELAFAGVNYSVDDGVVTLRGNCPTEKERNRVVNVVKETAGVKSVNDLIRIAPVILDADLSLQQAVDNVLKKYSSVKGVVKDSVITVQGIINSKKAQKMFSALQQLKAKEVINQLVITAEE